MWAKYNGILYDASIKSEEEVIIRSFKKSETDDSFFTKKYPDGKPIYIKYVQKSELEELYEEHEYGTWNGMEFELDGGAPKGWYTIWFGTGDYERDAEKIKKIESLGMKIVEPGLWRIEVPKKSLTNYHIVKEDLLHK